jgi:serine/threonine protein kinase/Tol biopolymer transport system component
MTGLTLGHYKIGELLGAGGMGEVYRARDTRLDRDIAIKVLPTGLAADADRIARFQREAKVLASLNHPNIASLYGFEESDGTHFLVMELVEGETLAQRIARAPIAPVEALSIGSQIAEACEAAHEKGVIHRDLKPANIKITPEGKVKVLDFGLAKALEGAPSSVVMANSPTISIAATNAGVILGTTAYMSPEQAKGLEASPRSDIFSFGCVLYEMHTGRQAFTGETVAEVIAHVIAREPDLAMLPANLNPRVPELLRRCLEKDPRRRWHAVADTRVEIDEILTDPRGVVLEAHLIAPRKPLWKRAIPAVAGLLAGAVLAGAATWRLKPDPPTSVLQFRFPLPENQAFSNSGRHLLTVAADGSSFVYAASGRLYLKKRDDFSSTPIPGSDVPMGGPMDPTFSPDGLSIAFYSDGDKTIKRTSLEGGTPVTICHASGVFGISWGSDNHLLFGEQGKGVMRVSADGGKADTIVAVEKNEEARNPQLLPGGSVLFTVVMGDKTNVVAQKPGSDDRKILVEGGTDARYLPIGQLVFAQGGDVLSVPFDVGRLERTDGPTPLSETVYTGGAQGIAQLAFSDSGTLVYVTKASPLRTVALVNREGKATPIALPPGEYETPRLSPNGKQLVLSVIADGERNIYVYDLVAKTSPRRLTFDGTNNRFPIWSADGKSIVFQSDREGNNYMFWQPADGITGKAERLGMPVARSGIHRPSDFARHASMLLFTVVIAGSRENDIYAYSIADRKSVVVVSEARRQHNAQLSPDGRWLLYESDESGRAEVYLQPYPPVPNVKFQISRGGGHSPLWSPSGKELFFVSGGALFSVSFETQPSPSFSEKIRLPVPAFIQPEVDPSNRQYDVTLDGQEFVMILPPGESVADTGPPPQVQAVVGWFEKLKSKAATR